MPKIPMQDPLSGEARSSWLAGLTEAVNKISGLLEMKISTFNNLPLPELFISEDDRYRIYQAPLGNKLWLQSPAPVIKKNGVVITPENDNFTIDFLGGSIAFDNNSRLTASDSITVDATYIVEGSASLETLANEIDATAAVADHFKGYFTTYSELSAITGTNGDFAIVGNVATEQSLFFDVYQPKPNELPVRVNFITPGFELSYNVDNTNTIQQVINSLNKTATFFGATFSFNAVSGQIVVSDDDLTITANSETLTTQSKDNEIYTWDNSKSNWISITGNYYTKDETNTILDAKQDTLTGAAGEVVGFDADGAATAVEGWSNPNLLINWDFRNPVNRNGLSEYSGAVYGIDMWKGFTQHAHVTIAPDGVTIGAISGTTSTVTKNILQSVDGFRWLAGKTIH